MLYLPAGKRALPQSGTLQEMTTTRAQTTAGHGLTLLPAVSSEALYRLESCDCYSVPGRPSGTAVSPIVGMRTPARAINAQARAVVMSVQLDVFSSAQVLSTLRTFLLDELGVVAP